MFPFDIYVYMCILIKHDADAGGVVLSQLQHADTTDEEKPAFSSLD